MNKLTLVVLVLLAGCTATLPRPSGGSSASVSLPIVKHSIGVPGTHALLYRRYQQELQGSLSNVLSSSSLSPGKKCSLSLLQLPGGEIFKIDFPQCQLPPGEQEQVRSRLIGVQLPYKGFEAVFNRQLFVNLCASSVSCEP